MKRRQHLSRVKMARPSLRHVQISKATTMSLSLREIEIIKKLDFNEKLELFQQIEVAQGIRKKEKPLKPLSIEAQKILRKYETLSSEREKKLFAERVKNAVFLSLKKAIAQG